MFFFRIRMESAKKTVKSKTFDSFGVTYARNKWRFRLLILTEMQNMKKKRNEEKI